MSKVLDWCEARPGWAAVIVLGILVLAVWGRNAELQARCDRLMALAPTAPDSLAAGIACEKMRSDADMADAIRSQPAPMRYVP